MSSSWAPTRRLALAAAAALVLPRALAAQPVTEIAIRVEDRVIRATGIELGRPEPETGASDISLPGQVVVPPNQLRILAAPTSGLVEGLFVAPDERVRAGQVVARLRSAELVEAQRLFLQAATAHDLAAEKLRRDDQLFRERVIAERRLIVTRAEANAAAAALDERTQVLTLLGMSEAEVADLRSSRRIRQSLDVVSPGAGVVIGREATPGERVAAAAPLVTVAVLDPLWVNLQVPLARAAAIYPNNRVIIPALGAEGYVLRIGRTADATTQSITVVAEMNAGVEALRPGQAVTVVMRIRGNGAPQWRVPAGAVVRHRERNWVFVRTPTGFVARPVQVLNETGQATSVVANFAPGDQIAVRGILSLLGELAEAYPG